LKIVFTPGSNLFYWEINVNTQMGKSISNVENNEINKAMFAMMYLKSLNLSILFDPVIHVLKKRNSMKNLSVKDITSVIFIQLLAGKKENNLKFQLQEKSHYNCDLPFMKYYFSCSMYCCCGY
jgi:thiamine pyrophosphokinase